MKIFQVITVSEYGGAQTIVADLLKNLSPEHKLFVLYGGNGEAWSDLGDNFTRIRLGSHRKKAGLKDIWLAIKLFYYRLRYRPDIVHLHSSKMGILGRILFNPKKVILTMHGFDSVRKAYPQFLVIEKKLGSRAKRIIAVSEYDKKAMADEGIKDNVVRIYNGVEDNYSKHIKVNDHISRELDLIKTRYKHVVMCISRISPQKKFDLFVEIAKKLPETAFVWIGNKKPMPNLPLNTFCLGEAHGASNYLRYADIFCLPSNYEGLPISLIEALSYCKPVVASNVGGIGEILNGTNGYAIENDVDLFVSKIKHILSSKEIYTSMSEQARKTYLEKLTKEEMIEQYITVYNDIVDKKK